jgi:hypothetical protein
MGRSTLPETCSLPDNFRSPEPLPLSSPAHQVASLELRLAIA